MESRPPGGQVGYTAAQRAAIRAVEEEAVLDVIGDFLRRADRLADRLESFARSPAKDTGEGPKGNGGP